MSLAEAVGANPPARDRCPSVASKPAVAGRRGRLYDHAMARLVVLSVTVAALLTASCGRTRRPLPTACTTGAPQVAEALRSAPTGVALADGTRLSACVELAHRGADIQDLGAIYTRVADELSAQVEASNTAATRLGYLIGATRRGSRQTNGIHVELVRRLEQTMGLDGAPPPRRAAFSRGLNAGWRSG